MSDAREIDIATGTMGRHVHRELQARLYVELLRALQVEAKRLGYHFVDARLGHGPETLPSVLLEALAQAVALARRKHLAPSKPDVIREDLDDGSAHRLVSEMLKILKDIGLGLQAQAGAEQLLAQESAARDEIAREMDSSVEGDAPLSTDALLDRCFESLSWGQPTQG